MSLYNTECFCGKEVFSEIHSNFVSLQRTSLWCENLPIAENLFEIFMENLK